jgi:hypothetical protein
MNTPVTAFTIVSSDLTFIYVLYVRKIFYIALVIFYNTRHLMKQIFRSYGLLRICPLSKTSTVENNTGYKIPTLGNFFRTTNFIIF